MKYTYTLSTLLPGDGEFLRERSFTRWMSRDLHQAASDFVKYLGLLAIYVECSAERKRRHLYWRPPEGCLFEIRSGRSLEQFEQLDQVNVLRGWPLLSLHLNENSIYSAVWISNDHYDAAKQVLQRYGITPAERTAQA